MTSLPRNEVDLLRRARRDSRRVLVCSAALTWAVACSPADETATDGAGDGSGGGDSVAATGGGTGATGGSFSTGGSPVGATASGGTAAGGSASGGSSSGGTSTGGVPSGGSSAGGAESSTGGVLGSGGAASGGSDGTGGLDGSGGSDGAGGSDGSGGSVAVDPDGCPITQEGFSTVDALGQIGTYGGSEGATVTVTNQSDLEQYALAPEPYVIRVQGTITISPKGEEIEIASDKTIIGVGQDAVISEGGFVLEGAHNVIIRNLTIGDTYLEGDWDGKQQDWDGVQMDGAHHVWIDHCDFHHIGDGIIDSREDTTNLTVSWNTLRDHNKAFGIGWTDNVTAEMTIHHNVFRDTGTRNPSTDNVLRAHMYNNWLLRAGGYGNWARGGTNMVIEHSVFEDMGDPHYYDSGSLVAIGNIYISTSGQQESSGSSYSFFDPSDFYDYDLDPAEDVTDILGQCTGPRASLGN